MPEQLQKQIDSKPDKLEYLWSWYNELAGPVALTFQEVKAWAELTCRPIEPREVDAVMSLDRLFWRTVK